MNFAQLFRLIWIDHRLHTHGKVNRKHIMAAFGISKPQAVIDIRAFRDSHPTTLSYDRVVRAYTRSAFTPAAYPLAVRIAVREAQEAVMGDADIRLNPLADERSEGPFVPVSLSALGEAVPS